MLGCIMVQNDWLIQLFNRRVDELASENSLDDCQKQQIKDVFQFALENPYADERQLYARLTQKDSK